MAVGASVSPALLVLGPQDLRSSRGGPFCPRGPWPWGSEQGWGPGACRAESPFQEAGLAGAPGPARAKWPAPVGRVWAARQSLAAGKGLVSFLPWRLQGLA